MEDIPLALVSSSHCEQRTLLDAQHREYHRRLSTARLRTEKKCQLFHSYVNDCIVTYDVGVFVCHGIVRLEKKNSNIVFLHGRWYCQLETQLSAWCDWNISGKNCREICY